MLLPMNMSAKYNSYNNLGSEFFLFMKLFILYKYNSLNISFLKCAFYTKYWRLILYFLFFGFYYKNFTFYKVIFFNLYIL